MRGRIKHSKPTTTSVHGVLTSEHPEVSSFASLGGSFAQFREGHFIRNSMFDLVQCFGCRPVPDGRLQLTTSTYSPYSS